MDELKSMKEIKGEVPLVPLARALEHLRQVVLGDRQVSWLRVGRQEVLRELAPPKNGERMVCLSDVEREPIALAQWVRGAGGGTWQLFRVFASL